PGPGIATGLGGEVIHTLVHDDRLSKDVLVVVIAAYAPFPGGKVHRGIAVGIRHKVSYIPFVVSLGSAPLAMGLKGRVPVSTGGCSIGRGTVGFLMEVDGVFTGGKSAEIGLHDHPAIVLLESDLSRDIAIAFGLHVERDALATDF